MSKAGEGESVRTAIDLKEKINRTLAKYKKLNIIFKEPEGESATAVDKEEIPQSSQPTKTETETDWKFGTNVPESVTVADLELDPTTPQAQLAVLKKKKNNMPK
jgi:hypothetical protein